MKINFTNQQLEDLKTKYQEGYNTYDLGKLYNCSPKIISKKLKEIGINIRNKKDSSKKFFFSYETIDKMYEFYTKEKLSFKRLGEIYGCSGKTIKYNFQQKGLISNKINSLKFSIEQILSICTLYKSGLSTLTVGKLFNCSYQTIRNILIQNNIELRDRHHQNKKYFNDEMYFNIIDSEDKAYWLGWLYADGNVYGNTVSLGLQKNDRNIIENFKKSLKTNKPIEENTSLRNETICYNVTLRINSDILTKDLHRLGCVSNKSDNLKFPKKTKFLNIYYPISYVLILRVMDMFDLIEK